MQNFISNESSRTLNTLRRIAAIGEHKERARKEFAVLRVELGDDYLKQLKNRVRELKEEVIIAVENRNQTGTEVSGGS
jgi:hypothetical protein